MSREVAVNTGSRTGIGLASIVTIIFVIAKVWGIGEIADWSWWWVFSPLWIVFALLIAVVVVGLLVWGIGLGISELAYKIKMNRRRKASMKGRK